ncbi:MAG TPA: LuxR C-terminal-related transcriptional regulator [Acidimicrobiia bacterium]|nr:LuxR C-terminal-related transcriptional regulator [Acidimicrobiia bacterium]
MAPLVERDTQLEMLHSIAQNSARQGGLVFVLGEAGHGKTSLVGAFVDGLDHRFRTISLSCEPLGRPLAFGPLLATADALSDAVHEELGGGLRPSVYRAMLELLRSEQTVLVVEDLQWADEATLGLVRHLGRHVAQTSSIVIGTLRPEEIDPAHPFQVLTADIGRLATRIELPPLTIDGVRRLAGDTAVDPVAVHATTSGSPFFVEEILRHPDTDIPATIADAVEATVGSLSPEAREMVELVSLMADGIALDLVADREDAVDLACRRRLLVVAGGRIRCRHDLIRDAVARAMPPARTRRLHRHIVSLLQKDTSGLVRTAELAYHSHRGGLGKEAALFSVDAARTAARTGSHREAARAYGWAYEHRRAVPTDEIAAVLRAAAYEHLLVNDFLKAIEIARTSLDLAQDDLERSEADAWVAFFAMRQGDIDLAERHAEAAVAILQPLGPSVALARAEAVLAVIPLARGVTVDAVSLARHAVAAARACGARAVEADALITLGSSLVHEGRDEGYGSIEEGGRVAREVGSLDAAARAVYTLGALPFQQMRLAEAVRQMDEGLAYLASEELDAWYVAVEVTRAHISVLQGDWNSAAEALDRVLPRSTCLSTEAEVALVEARRLMRLGESGALAALDLGLSRTDTGVGYAEDLLATELAMEAAWLGLLDEGAAADRYARMADTARRVEDGWALSRLAFWALRLGIDPPSGPLPGPVDDEIVGDSIKSAVRWKESGYPVEAAIVDAFTPGASLREVFGELERLGALGVVDGLRRRLREQGVTGIPRGAQQASEAHPAGLTARQQDVLALIVGGCSNDDIAAELFISPKTVSHHVSAILAKLGVDSRVQAAALAHSNDWV